MIENEQEEFEDTEWDKISEENKKNPLALCKYYKRCGQFFPFKKIYDRNYQWMYPQCYGV